MEYKKSIITRQLIIDETKKIIVEQGYENITVRKISEQTKLSFTLIYKYYKDLEELLWQVRLSIIEDISQNFFLLYNQTQEDRLNVILTEYVKYMISQPHIFRFIYFKQFQVVDKDTYNNLIQQLLFKNIENIGLEYNHNQYLILKTIIYSIHGMILLYISNSESIRVEEILNDLNHLLNKLKEEK